MNVGSESDAFSYFSTGLDSARTQNLSFRVRMGRAKVNRSRARLQKLLFKQALRVRLFYCSDRVLPSPPLIPKSKYQTFFIFRILCWAVSNRSPNEKGQSCTFTARAFESRYTRLLSQDFSHIYFFPFMFVALSRHSRLTALIILHICFWSSEDTFNPASVCEICGIITLKLRLQTAGARSRVPDKSFPVCV